MWLRADLPHGRILARPATVELASSAVGPANQVRRRHGKGRPETRPRRRRAEFGGRRASESVSATGPAGGAGGLEGLSAWGDERAAVCFQGRRRRCSSRHHVCGVSELAGDAGRRAAANESQRLAVVEECWRVCRHGERLWRAAAGASCGGGCVGAEEVAGFRPAGAELQCGVEAGLPVWAKDGGTWPILRDPSRSRRRPLSVRARGIEIIRFLRLSGGRDGSCRAMRPASGRRQRPLRPAVSSSRRILTRPRSERAGLGRINRPSRPPTEASPTSSRRREEQREAEAWDGLRHRRFGAMSRGLSPPAERALRR